MLQSHRHELNHGALAPNLKLVSLTLIEHPAVKKEKKEKKKGNATKWIKVDCIKDD